MFLGKRNISCPPPRLRRTEDLGDRTNWEKEREQTAEQNLARLNHYLLFRCLLDLEAVAAAANAKQRLFLHAIVF